jgi:hypothetical protein
MRRYFHVVFAAAAAGRSLQRAGKPAVFAEHGGTFGVDIAIRDEAATAALWPKANNLVADARQ